MQLGFLLQDFRVRQALDQVVDAAEGEVVALQVAGRVFGSGIRAADHFGGRIAPLRLPVRPGADAEQGQRQHDHRRQQGNEAPRPAFLGGFA